MTEIMIHVTAEIMIHEPTNKEIMNEPNSGGDLESGDGEDHESVMEEIMI
jgi:hypothetical protein